MGYFHVPFLAPLFPSFLLTQSTLFSLSNYHHNHHHHHHHHHHPHPQVPATLRDSQWATFTCMFGWSVQGVWPVESDYVEINACQALSEVGDVITGKTLLFIYQDQDTLSISTHPLNVNTLSINSKTPSVNTNPPSHPPPTLPFNPPHPLPSSQPSSTLPLHPLPTLSPTLTPPSHPLHPHPPLRPHPPFLSNPLTNPL